MNETFEEISSRLERIEKRLAETGSPFLRGDLAAANFAGFKSRNAFRAWAKENGIRPEIRGGLNLWRKDHLT